MKRYFAILTDQKDIPSVMNNTIINVFFCLVKTIQHQKILSVLWRYTRATPSSNCLKENSTL